MTIKTAIRRIREEVTNMVSCRRCGTTMDRDLGTLIGRTEVRIFEGVPVTLTESRKSVHWCPRCQSKTVLQLAS